MTRSSYPDKHPTRPSGRGAARRQQENTPQLFGREGEQARLRQLLDAAACRSDETSGGARAFPIYAAVSGVFRTGFANQHTNLLDLQVLACLSY
jgi:hypothetical protein